MAFSRRNKLKAANILTKSISTSLAEKLKQCFLNDKFAFRQMQEQIIRFRRIDKSTKVKSK